ncbi:MAG: ATP synthase F1 subunit delta [Candidatus Eisenbacteria sp.]|nr:ATP synthase F1 subunit delta [Candidatus Eisenbacteria bacterium]
MIDGLVGRRYASALLAAALEGNAVDRVEKDLNSIKEIWEQNPDLGRLLENPDMRLEEKRQFLDRVFPESLDGLVRRFLEFLLEKKRIEFLVSAALEFHELAKEMRNQCEAHVTSISALTDPQRQGLREALARLTGKDVHLVEKVDPEVIGGLRVRMKDRVIDRTVRSELVQLRENLLAARLLGRSAG